MPSFVGEHMLKPAVAVALGLGLALTGCGTGGSTDGSGSGSTGEVVNLPDDGDALVLRVAYTGGFVTPETTVSRLPLVSIYRDGRVITQGPVIAIYPSPAWPNVQVGQVDEDTVFRLAGAAVDAGVTATTDLGSPNIADAPSTTFTLVTAEQTFVRDAYALTEASSGPGPIDAGSGITDEQQTARAALADLMDQLTSLVPDTTGYQPTAVAAIAAPYVEPDGATLGNRPAVAWPGPALPGDPIGPGIGCVVATAEQATAVATAAQGADSLTPWTSGDTRWSVTFRPLLPEETGCADLAG